MNTSAPNRHPINEAIKECSSLFWIAFWFGLFINLLMLAAPLYSLQVLDRVLSSGSHDTLLMLTIIVGIALVFMSGMQILRALIFNQLGRWLDDKLSTDLVNKTVEASINHKKLGTQPLRDLQTIRGFVTSPHLGNLFDAPWAIIFFVVIYLINVYLGLLVTLGAAILSVFAYLSHRLPLNTSLAANDEHVKSMQALDDILRNVEVIKSMGLLGNVSKRWRDHNGSWLENTFATTNINTIVGQLTRMFRLVIQVLVMGVGAFLVLGGDMSPGAIIAVSMLTGRALAPFDNAAALYQNWVGVHKALDRLHSVDDLVPQSAETTTLPDPQGNIRVQELYLKAQASDTFILRNIDLALNAGEALGILGASGSGKTTLARLLVGVIEPTKGHVRLDKSVLQQWNPIQLGEAIGYLPQDVELFTGTIAQNIARFRPDASDELVVQAAKTAMVHDRIVEFPEGYNTQIGVNGASLSAGQRQRIALARCFYGNPKFIVLDEPNANLDGDGEMALLKALANAKEFGITTVTIAHRLSVIQQVDKILILNNGEIKSFGPAQDVINELTSQNNKVHPIKSKLATVTA